MRGACLTEERGMVLVGPMNELWVPKLTLVGGQQVDIPSEDWIFNGEY